MTEPIRIGKYLFVIKHESGRCTVMSAKAEILGMIEYYARWRRLVFKPFHGSLYSHDCLADLSKYLKEANAK